MSIDSIDDVIKTLNVLNNHSNLQDYLDEYVEGDGSSVIIVNYIEDDDLREDIDEIELSASHFFLNEDGSINKLYNDRLKKQGYVVEKLSNRIDGITHSIGCDRFKIYFSNY
jgi:hypothetical protein